jgi:hypothetical protein
VKKSSMRSWRIERGIPIDSAPAGALKPLTTACAENDASVAATFEGDVGEDRLLRSLGDSSLCLFFAASACLLGGPRRRLGRSKVH